MSTQVKTLTGRTYRADQFEIGEQMVLEAGVTATLSADAVAIAFSRDRPYDIALDWESAAALAREGYAMLAMAGDGDGDFDIDQIQVLLDRERASAADRFGAGHLK